MNGFLTEPIILTGEQSTKFINSLCRPNSEYLDRMSKIFNKMDEEISIQRKGMDLEVEIADLDLSFIDEENLKESVSPFDVELSTEVSFVLDMKSMDSMLFEKINRLVTVAMYTDDQNKTRRERCIYNEMGRDNSEASVTGKGNDYMINACKVEQIIFAA